MQKYSKEYFQKMGRKGGKTTLKRHGSKHFSNINPKKRRLKQGFKWEMREVIPK